MCVDSPLLRLQTPCKRKQLVTNTNNMKNDKYACMHAFRRYPIDVSHARTNHLLSRVLTQIRAAVMNKKARASIVMV